MWSPAGHTQALCSKPHCSHTLFHQIHHSRNTEAGTPIAMAGMTS